MYVNALFLALSLSLFTNRNEKLTLCQYTGCFHSPALELIKVASNGLFVYCVLDFAWGTSFS